MSSQTPRPVKEKTGVQVTPPLGQPNRNWVLLKLITDAGITGLGECVHGGHQAIAIIKDLEQRLIGLDPFAIDPLNGTATTLPVSYPLFNAEPGFGFFGLAGGLEEGRAFGRGEYKLVIATAEVAFMGQWRRRKRPWPNRRWRCILDHSKTLE